MTGGAGIMNKKNGFVCFLIYEQQRLKFLKILDNFSPLFLGAFLFLGYK